MVANGLNTASMCLCPAKLNDGLSVAMDDKEARPSVYKWDSELNHYPEELFDMFLSDKRL